MKKAASFFKILADKARLKMLWLLLNHRELCVYDFMAVLDITQSKASRHLRTLYTAGLICNRRAGNWIYYSLRPASDDFSQAFSPETLHTALASRQDAVELLRKLTVWLEQKGAGQTRLARRVSDSIATQ